MSPDLGPPAKHPGHHPGAQVPRGVDGVPEVTVPVMSSTVNDFTNPALCPKLIPIAITVNATIRGPIMEDTFEFLALPTALTERRRRAVPTT